MFLFALRVRISEMPDETCPVGSPAHIHSGTALLLVQVTAKVLPSLISPPGL